MLTWLKTSPCKCRSVSLLTLEDLLARCGLISTRNFMHIRKFLKHSCVHMAGSNCSVCLWHCSLLLDIYYRFVLRRAACHGIRRCIYWMKTLVTSSELRSEKLRGVPVKMTPCSFPWMETWGGLQLFFYSLPQEVEEEVSQIQLFGECLYHTISRERRWSASASDQSFSLLMYNSFILMGSLSPLDILLLINSKAKLCVFYYVSLKGC